MEFKGVSSAVVLMILLVVGNAIADDCYENCTASCPVPLTIECFKHCGSECSGGAIEGLAKKTRGHHHHCKDGCSNHCLKHHHHDKKKLERCMHHCTTNCSIRAPSPSPIPQ